MKKLLAALLAVTMLLSLGIFAYAEDDPYADLDPIEVNIVYGGAEGEEPGPELVAIWDDIVEASNGKITYNMTNNGTTLFGTTQMYEMLMSGSIDFCNFTPDLFTSAAPEIELFCWPYIFESTDAIDAFWTGEASKALCEKIEANAGMTVLTGCYAGTRNVYTTDLEVKTPADLEGVKMRSMGANIYVQGLTAMGAIAVPIAYSELYFSLQTGVVLGHENVATSVQAGAIYEVQNTACMTEHLYSMNVFCANTEFWNGLPEAYQTLIRDTYVAHYNNGEYAEYLQGLNQEIIGGFAEEHGFTVVTDVDKQAFIDVCDAAFVENYGDNEDWMALYNAIKA